MAGHFECLGFEGQEEVMHVIEQTVREGDGEQRRDGGFRFVWREDDGARVVVNTSEAGDVLCATPSFSSESRIGVSVNGIGRDPECGFCSRLFVEVLEEGEMAYPLAVQAEDMEPTSDVAAPARSELGIAAFAEEIEVWADEAAYAHSTRDSQVPLAPQSVIPVGLFGPGQENRRWFRRTKKEPPAARALITGIVQQARLRENSETSRSFSWATVATFGGSYDVVASGREVPGGFIPNTVVQGTFWLIATGRAVGSRA